MKKVKIILFALLILFVVIILTHFKDIQLLDDETIKRILSTETELDEALLSLKNEAEDIGLEIREISIKYEGMKDIADRNGICTLIAYKECDDAFADILYEGGKVELESISFAIKTNELIYNRVKLEHGKAVVIGSNQLEIEKWNGEIEVIVDSFISHHFDEIQALEAPIVFLTITNDKCAMNMRDGSTVCIIEEYNMISE